MRFGQRTVVRMLAWQMRRHRAPGDLLTIRCVFDDEFKWQPEEWRRETWAAAAERAQNQRFTGNHG